MPAARAEAQFQSKKIFKKIFKLAWLFSFGGVPPRWWDSSVSTLQNPQVLINVLFKVFIKAWNKRKTLVSKTLLQYVWLCLIRHVIDEYRKIVMRVSSPSRIIL